MRIRQEVVVDNNGVSHNVCPHCKKIIKYPFGVYFRNGIEVHTQCIVVLRMPEAR